MGFFGERTLWQFSFRDPVPLVKELPHRDGPQLGRPIVEVDRVTASLKTLLYEEAKERDLAEPVDRFGNAF